MKLAIIGCTGLVGSVVLKVLDELSVNCSTIQLAVALNEIHRKFGLKRIVISTYQSVTGTGKAAVTQMYNERKGLKSDKIYPHPIDQNCFPHGGDFLENGYTSEEMKLVDETQKIFNDNNIKITATVVRIPVIGGHSEAVNVETHRPFEIKGLWFKIILRLLIIQCPLQRKIKTMFLLVE